MPGVNPKRKVKKSKKREALVADPDMSGPNPDDMIPRSLEMKFPGDEILRPHNEVFIDKLYESSKNLIVDLINGDNIIESVADLSAKLMQGAATYQGITGPEKKVIVLKVMRRIFSEIPTTEATNQLLGLILTNVVPRVIDVIIAAADGKIDLRRKFRDAKKYWNMFVGLCCCGCARSCCACN